LEKDFLLYMIPSRGFNAKGSTPMIKKFLEICEKYDPVNIGCLYPSVTKAQPRGTLRGDSMEEMKTNVVDRTEAIVTFVNDEKVTKVLDELREADLGISVVVTGVFDRVFDCCKEAKLTPHTVNMALGIEGRTERLPPRKVLDLVTMCGHGLVSPYLVDDLVSKVETGRITPEAAAEKLGVNCVCGAFNPARAAELISDILESS
jgi:hypothetical protein